MSPRHQQPLQQELALLGFLLDKPRHGYELYQQFCAADAPSAFWQPKQSQFYAMLNRLEQAGYLRSQLDTSVYPPRKVLHLTSAGQAAFAVWLHTPFPADENEQALLTRLFFVRQQGASATQAWLVQQRDSLSQQRTQQEYTLRHLPDPSGYAALVAQWQIQRTDALLAWLDVVQWQIAPLLTVAYPIAALADSPHAALAAQFVSFVRGRAGQAILAQHGFLAGDAPPDEPPAAPPPVAGQLTVFAAASLTAAFTALAAEFAAAHSGCTIRLQAAGSYALARQLIEGATADVFAAAHTAPMQMLVEAGRVRAADVAVCAHNRLAIIAGQQPHPALISELEQPGQRLVIGSDDTAIGHHTLELLRHSEQAGLLSRDASLAIFQNVVSYAATPQKILAQVQAGTADAGIVFASDCHALEGCAVSPSCEAASSS